MKHLGKILLGVVALGGIAALASKKSGDGDGDDGNDGNDGQEKDGVTYGTASQFKKIEGYEFFPQMASWKVWHDENNPGDYKWSYRMDIMEGHFEEGSTVSEADTYAALDATLEQNGYRR